MDSEAVEAPLVQGKHLPAIVAEEARECLGLLTVPLQKAQGTEEVLVVVIGLGLVLEGVHLVGRGREQQYPVLFEPEELVCEFARAIGPVEEMLEALELVEDDQVRLQGLKAGHGEELA